MTGEIKEYRNEPGRPARATTDAKAFPDSCGPLPPTLESPGSVVAALDVWRTDVAYDAIRFHPFAADFDGDGDDDVLLAATSFAVARTPRRGVILINNGDFTFTVAGGDRPRGVHQRQVLLADFDGDGRPDILLGGYDKGWFQEERGPWRGVQLLVNRGGRTLTDETARRLGASSWSEEAWQLEHRFFDFNGDGTLDIVPHLGGNYGEGHGENVIAWLNDGTGRYAPLKTTEFDDAEALERFANGLAVQSGDGFSFIAFSGDGAYLEAKAAVVVEGAVLRRR